MVDKIFRLFTIRLGISELIGMTIKIFRLFTIRLGISELVELKSMVILLFTCSLIRCNFLSHGIWYNITFCLRRVDRAAPDHYAHL
jgi:hypothetical protein